MPTFDPPSVPLARPGKAIVVARYDPELDPPDCFLPLPNIVCTQVQWRIDADPGVARFRYVFDPQVLGDEFPWRTEHVLSFASTGPYVIRQDDRLCVFAFDADGSWSILFDGFAQVPQADLSRKTETVTFEALGVAVREWDTPLGGAIYREGPDPSVVSDVETGLPARFNPDGIGNASPTNGNVAAVGRTYPTFCDLVLDPDTRRTWNLNLAVRYVFGVGGSESEYIQGFNDFAIGDNIFDSRTPKGESFDPSDPSTYDSHPIIVQDLDVTGKPWPVALSELLNPHNIGYYFRLELSDSGRPKTVVDFYRRDGGDGIAPKDVFLQPAGDTFSPGQTNVGEFHVSRDASQVRNRIVIDTSPPEYEIGAVLAPGFEIASGDAATPNKYTIGDPDFTGDNVDKYRVYHFAEAGDSWWDFPTSAMKTDATSLDDVFGEPYEDIPGEPVIPRYAKRRRKPNGTLITTNGGKRISAELWISKDYNTPIPGLWDGTGTWQQVATGQWSLLKDRIGIRIDAKEVHDLNVGKPSTENSLYPTNSGKFNLLKSQANPDTPNPRVFFRLTCVIEGDEDLDVVATKRSSSSTRFEITQRIETRDRFRKRLICVSSPHNESITDEDEIDVDETDEAQAYAEAMRNAHETASFAGTIKVLRFTNAYRVGDRIRRIVGRDIDLSVTSASEQGEAARYPMVVGVTWDFDGGQSTSIQLSDMRSEPARERTG